MQKILPVVLQVGTKVRKGRKVHTVLAYNKDLNHCLIDNVPTGHDGLGVLWYDENGNRIKKFKGSNRFWIDEKSLRINYNPIINEEPEFIFGI